MENLALLDWLDFMRKASLIVHVMTGGSWIIWHCLIG
jgi:hypothetical protein